VRLPAFFRFDASEVFVRRDVDTGDVILSLRPAAWDGFIAALQQAGAATGIADEKERKQRSQQRDPLKGWKE
jgi:antitoxin VapB